MIDMGSNAGLWSGEMPVWGEAVLEIAWIEMLFNASALSAEDVPKRGKVCPMDKPSMGANLGLNQEFWSIVLAAIWTVAFVF
jgi:hypothetical protein